MESSKLIRAVGWHVCLLGAVLGGGSVLAASDGGHVPRQAIVMAGASKSAVPQARPASYQLAQAGGQIPASGPQDGWAWRARGDALAEQGRTEEALDAYRKAEDMGAGDEQLTIAIGDLLKDTGRKAEAYREFEKLYHSADPAVRETACQQINYLAPYRTKRLPDPYFAELYVQAGWQSIGDTAYINSEARLGANLLPDEALQVYAIGRYIRDNRSGVVGGFPREYFDNVAIVGIGARAKPFAEIPLYFLAETGQARDLIDLDRDRNRSDTRAGVTYYQEWNTDRACTGGVRYPFRFVNVVSAESMYYSRYDDAVLTSVDVRPGIRVMESDFSSVDVSLVGSVYGNSEADDFVQYKQLGAAITWVPDAHYDLKIVAEGTRTFFTDAEDENNYNLYFIYSAYF